MSDTSEHKIAEIVFPFDKPLLYEYMEDNKIQQCMLHKHVTVSRRDCQEDIWVIEVGSGSVLNKNGAIEFEPSNQTDDFIQRTRFSYDDAIKETQSMFAKCVEYPMPT